MFHVPNKYRIREGRVASDESYGNNGAFKIKNLNIIASDGYGWEHVSISLPHRAPKWNEMCRVKEMFWDDTDTVVQFHPPKNDYVNNHNYCLHLWCYELGFPRPPSTMVGIKDLRIIREAMLNE